MGPKNQRSSPNKSSDSPAAKKSKISPSREDDGKVNNMAAPTARGSAASNARRLLDLGTESLSQDHDKPPVWFANFEVRLEQFLDTKIISKLNDLTTRVSEQDETLTAVTMQVTDLEKQIKSLEADKAHLISKVDDIENRSRRNNLVFYGVPEAEQSSCVETVKDIFAFVGLNPDEIPIERCHRTPTFRRNDQEKPRMIHVAFQTFSQKEMVRKECIKKFKTSQFMGKKVFVDDDFSDRIRRLRREKMDTFKRLKAENKRPFFVYPAIIRYRNQTTGKLITAD